ncbi:MAG: STAS domain-containing protein [Hyphomicrobium sp.]
MRSKRNTKQPGRRPLDQIGSAKSAIAKSDSTTRSRKKSPSRARTGDSEPLVLPGVLDMRTARDLKRQLEERFHLQRACVIDASPVTSISTGCVQILLAFARTMGAKAASVTIRQPSAALLDAVSLLGLSQALSTCISED